MLDDVIEILLVEDSAEDEELTLHALRSRKLANRIQVVHDGAEALDFIFRRGIYGNRSSQNPNLILLDLNLPKVDGLEVLRRIRNDPQTQSIPVVVLTSSQDERDAVESQQLGVTGYMVKPVDFEQFAQTVQHIGYYWLVFNQPPGLEGTV